MYWVDIRVCWQGGGAIQYLGNGNSLQLRLQFETEQLLRGRAKPDTLKARAAGARTGHKFNTCVYPCVLGKFLMKKLKFFLSQVRTKEGVFTRVHGVKIRLGY